MRLCQGWGRRDTRPFGAGIPALGTNLRVQQGGNSPGTAGTGVCVCWYSLTPPPANLGAWKINAADFYFLSDPHTQSPSEIPPSQGQSQGAP